MQSLTFKVFEKIAVTVVVFFSHAGNSFMWQAGLMTDHYILLFLFLFFYGSQTSREPQNKHEQQLGPVSLLPTKQHVKEIKVSTI